MDLPVNHFKRAIAAGKRPSARGCRAARRRPPRRSAAPASTSSSSTPSTRRSTSPQMIDILRTIAGNTGAGDRAAAVERHGDDQARARRRRAVAAAAVRAERGRGATRGRLHALSAGRRARGRRDASREPLRHVTDYLKRANAELCVIVQIETAERARRLEAIAAVPRRRFDLRRARTICRRRWASWATWDNAAVQEKLARGREAVPPPRQALRHRRRRIRRWSAQFLDYGYSWVAIGSDMRMMVGRAQEFLGKVRAAAADERRGRPAVLARAA